MHPNAANVLLLRRVPAAPRWHLKVSACGWLADLHGNTGNPNAAPGPTTSATLPPPWGPIRHVTHPHRSSLVKITSPVVFVLYSLPPSKVDRSSHWSEKVRSHPDVWWIGLLFQQLDWEDCGPWLTVHVGERVLANWMNELICYGNEVKADRRPSGQEVPHGADGKRAWKPFKCALRAFLVPS